MTRFGLKTCVMLVSLTCFLTLVLPFCVPPAESRMFVSGGGSGGDRPSLGEGTGGNPPPPPPADPDDIAVNSARGTGGGVVGGYGFGNEKCVIMAGTVMTTEQVSPFKEVPVASTGRDSARWLLLVWVLASQLY